MERFGNDWDKLLKDEFQKDYYLELQKFLEEERKNYIIYPKEDEVFSALKTSSYKDTKVVIFGQDPYHEEGQAHGMAFSVKPGVKVPPSLKNIYKELRFEYEDYEVPNTGYLMKWAEQGVLLLNTALTVRAGHANSHRKKGWEKFTDRIIEILNEKEDAVIFVLWGNNARAKKKLIKNSRHFILEAAHPSPLSACRGFFGCDHFRRVNRILRKLDKKPIDWQI